MGIIQTRKQKSFWPTVLTVSETTPSDKPFLGQPRPYSHRAGRLRSEQGKGSKAALEPARISQTVTIQSAETVHRVPIQDKGEVREFYEGIDNLRARLEDHSRQFKAGQIRHCVPQLEEITQDKDSVKVVEGVDIDF